MNQTVNRTTRSIHPPALFLLSTALLAGCAVGPAYERPAVPLGAYKQSAKAGEAEILEQWWKLYGDERLNALMGEVEQANQNIRQGEARYRQALALSEGARSALWPSLSLNASVRRGSGSGGGTGNAANGNIATSDRLSADASWEADLWGRVRKQADSAQLAAEASEVDVAAVRLAVQASFAQLYFQVHIADAQQRLLDETVQAYERSLQLTQNRYRAGVATPGDVAQAQAQLKSTQAQALDNRVLRAQLEHALAVLLGRMPSAFTLEPDVTFAASRVQVPVVPAGVPSSQLERRPDVAAAERRVASASANIGAAQAALFPSLTLTASGGFQSTQASQWLSLPNRVWAVGPALAASLFDHGSRRAQSDAAVAAYDAAVASYRQIFLGSVQEVEDALAALAWLEQETELLDAAVRAARESERQMLNHYQAGMVDYLNVATVQTTALAAERNALAVLGRRLTASVGLVKALGGGWNTKVPG